jgi:DNA-binding response OmpR family regulator
MNSIGSVLIADDEDTFRQSTAYLLRERGYACDCAADGPEALRLFRQNDYDLLVADIGMPGNTDLSLIRQAQEVTGGMPVILVTGYPSVESATRSVPLPVVAYLTKPVDFEELCGNVEAVMSQSRTKRLAEKTLDIIDACARELRQTAQDLGGTTKLDTRARLAGSLAATTTSLGECYGALRRLQTSLTGSQSAADPCGGLKCGRRESLESAVRDGIVTIERTRSSFKSKELGDLRRRLSDALGHRP